MNNLRRIIFMVIAVVAFLLPASQPAQAKAWHSPNSFSWTIEAVCRNGVTVIMSDLTANEPADGEHFLLTLSFGAYHTTAAGGDVPVKIPYGDHVPIGESLGSTDVTMTGHETPYRWTDDENHTEGYSFVYGRSNITWSPLPLGRAVVVQWTGTEYYFVGNVTECRV